MQLDLAKATQADVSGWINTYTDAGDTEVVRVLNLLHAAIRDDDLSARLEAEGWLFDLLVMRRGVGQ